MYDTYIPLLTYAHDEGEAGSKVVPGLAESLPKVTDGGKTYTLKLRKGLKYSDGTPVKASDFKASVERMFKLNSSGSPYYTVIAGAEEFQEGKAGGISGIETDDKTGRDRHPPDRAAGRLRGPARRCCSRRPVPADTPGQDRDRRRRRRRPGPTRSSSSSRGAAGPTPATRSGTRPTRTLITEVPGGHVDKIEATVVSNQSTQVNDVEQGKTNWMCDPVPPDRVAEVKGKYEGSQYRVEPSIGVDFVWMNTTQPPFDDLKVRQAVNYAINPRQLERIYAGEIAATHQIIPPGVPGYEQYDLYPFDMAKAQQLLKEANPSDLDVTFWTDKPQRRGGRILRIGARRNRLQREAESGQLGNLLHGDRQRKDARTSTSASPASPPTTRNPNAFFEPLLAGREHPADEQHEPLQDRRSEAQREDRTSWRPNRSAPSRKTNTPRSTGNTWNRRPGLPTERRRRRCSSPATSTSTA